MKPFSLRVLAADRPVFEGECVSLVIPVEDGQYGILAHHSDFVSAITQNRVRLGPGTLYTILAKFEEEGLIRETAVEGRRRTYALTEAGLARYQEEIARLRSCLADAEREANRCE